MIYQQMLMLQFLQVINIGIAGLLSIKLLCVTLPHMSICTRVVVAVTFQQVDNAPDTETGTERDNEGLKNGDCLFKKCHIVC